MQTDVDNSLENSAAELPVEGMTPVVADLSQPAQAPKPAGKPLKSGQTAYTGWVTVQFAETEFVQKALEWSFRIGFSLVFIINSVTAIIEPEGFRKLIEGNFISQMIGHTQIMIYIIIANDALLGLFILFGWKKKWAYAWAGVWLFIVTFMKFTSLL